jgi:hypothetical protein
MPLYGYQCPSTNYFNSYLMVQNFVIADVTNGTIDIYFYNLRAERKDGSALCSLRMAYHYKAQPFH